jgi:hypothetical protein
MKGGNISEHEIKQKIEVFKDTAMKNFKLMKTKPFNFRIWIKEKMYYGQEALELFIKAIKIPNNPFPLPLMLKIPSLMLSTGLIDKNGKEIFQYDIIDSGDNFNSVIMYGEIVCTIGFFLREVHKKSGEYWPREHELMYLTSIPTETSIIGNVFETPKLAGTWWKKPRKF